MTAVKQQHYLPQFYLRSFTDERGFLHVVRRSGDHLGPSMRVSLIACAANHIFMKLRGVRRA